MATLFNPFQDDNEHDEVELMEDDYRSSSKDAILICIDASRSMQSPRAADERSFFAGSLGCAMELMKGKALTFPLDSVGVVVYNTSKQSAKPNKAEGDANGMHTLVPIGLLQIEPIQHLIDLLAAYDADPDFFSKEFPPFKSDQPTVPPGQLFDHCNQLVRSANIKTGSRRIFLITDDENPARGVSNRKQVEQIMKAARTRVKDLLSNGVSIVPYLLGNSERPFNVHPFWKHVLAPPGVNTAMSSGPGGSVETELIPASGGVTDLENLLGQMVTRQSSKRAMFTLPMIIASGQEDKDGRKRNQLVIGIKGYAHIVQAKKAATIMADMSGEGLLEAVPQTDYYDSIDKQNKNAFDPANLRQTFRHSKLDQLAAPRQKDPKAEDASDDEGGIGKYQRPSSGQAKDEPAQHGGITYSFSELGALKSLGLPSGINVLGFVGKEFLTFEMNVKNSYFISPDEHAYTGSRRTFASLNKTLLLKGKIGLCLCLFRRGSLPTLCALLPQEETFDEEDRQDKPPGFHLITIPFKDDMRGPPEGIKKAEENATMEADNMHVACMKGIITKLQMNQPYIPEDFPNPTLARYHAQLQALAFNEEFGEEEAALIEDRTAPLAETIVKRAGKRMKAFRDGVMRDERAFEAVEKPKKRRAEVDEDGGSPAKKPKAVARDMDIAVVLKKWKIGALDRYRVVDLEAFLKSVSVSCAHKRKTELIAAVEAYFRREGHSKVDD